MDVDNGCLYTVIFVGTLSVRNNLSDDKKRDRQLEVDRYILYITNCFRGNTLYCGEFCATALDLILGIRKAIKKGMLLNRMIKSFPFHYLHKILWLRAFYNNSCSLSATDTKRCKTYLCITFHHFID